MKTKRVLNQTNRGGNMNKNIKVIKALISIKNKNNPKQFKKIVQEFEKSFSDKLYVDG